MSQYGTRTDGTTATVENGSNLVAISAGATLIGVAKAGHLFTIDDSGVPYYLAADAVSNIQLVLTENYAGADASGQSWHGQSSRTTERGYDYAEADDIDQHTAFKSAMVKLDKDLSGTGEPVTLADGSSVDGSFTVNGALNATLNSNTTTGIATNNSSNGTLARNGLLATADAAAGFFGVNGSGYTGVSGWSDAGIVNINNASNGLILGLDGVTKAQITSTGVVVGGQLSANGAYATDRASQITLSMSAPTGQLIVHGPDNSTNPSWALYLVRANGTNVLTPIQVDSSGRTMMGTGSISIGTRLEVANTGGSALACVTSSVADYPIFAHNKATSGDNVFINFGTEASFTSRCFIDYNRAGNVGRYNTTSCETLKTIYGVAAPDKSIEILSNTVIREYAWKEDPLQKRQIGVIAQELYETYRGAVSRGGMEDITEPVMEDDIQPVEEDILEDVIGDLFENRFEPVFNAEGQRIGSRLIGRVKVGEGKVGERVVGTRTVNKVVGEKQVGTRKVGERFRPWAVDKTAYSFHLVVGWQEHQRQIAALEARIKALEDAAG